MNAISFIYELLFNRKRKKRQSLELFHSDEYLRPDHINHRNCPKCKTLVSSNKEAAEIFGLRYINGKPVLQSWCRKCRNDKNSQNELNLNPQESIDL
tara:strand:+ start:185 stop:475 length:291 start_codon:yes stop_codon:yes gene_type:complete